jgi:hypothetical protein
MKEYLVHLVGVVKEELDGQNSPRRIREISRAVISCRGVGSYGKYSSSAIQEKIKP